MEIEADGKRQPMNGKRCGFRNGPFRCRRRRYCKTRIRPFAWLKSGILRKSRLFDVST